MRQCPNCRTQYTDDMLQFCLQDGTPLVAVFTPPADDDENGESDTIVSAWKAQNRPAEPTNVGHRPIVEPRPASGKGRTLGVVLATFLGTILLLGLGAAVFGSS